MTRVELPDRTIGYNFQHPCQIDKDAEGGREENRYTVCELFLITKDHKGHEREISFLATGRDKWPGLHIYQKAKGRKNAMREALRLAGFDRDYRTLVWEAYLNRVQLQKDAAELRRLVAEQRQDEAAERAAEAEGMVAA